MKVTSLKTVYLTEEELKAAIIAYLNSRGKQNLARHLIEHECEMVWSQQEFAKKGQYFIVSMDGEFEEKTPIENRDAAVAEMVDQVTSCANKASQQVMKDHKETFQKLADNKVDT